MGLPENDLGGPSREESDAEEDDLGTADEGETTARPAARGADFTSSVSNFFGLQPSGSGGAIGSSRGGTNSTASPGQATPSDSGQH